MTRLSVALMFVALALGWSVPASGDNFTFIPSAHRSGPWLGPACESPQVAGRIMAKFNQAEAKYWHTGVRLAHIAYPRETTTRQWDPPIIATRFCSATAYLSDGISHELVYWLRSEQGFAGVGWGVEFCLVGRDRDMSFAPHCRMLRPL